MMVAYRALLRLYPKAHRELLGAEMRTVFEESARESRGQGRAAYLRFLLAELSGLGTGAMVAWIARMTRGQYLESQGSLQPASTTAHTLSDELLEAQNRVAFNLNQLVFAISHHDFTKARYYSNEERKAREDLRRLCEKYGIAGPGDAA